MTRQSFTSARDKNARTALFFPHIIINFNKQTQQNYLLMTHFRNKQQISPNAHQKGHQSTNRSSSKWNTNNAPSTIRRMPENEQDWSETMRNFLRDLLHEENKSMEDMLNSSINHFARCIQDHEDIQTQNHQLLQQNKCLRTAIDELKTILKQKLDEALKRQREDLNVMMQDYIQLIQKLLKDKEDFAIQIEEAVLRATIAEEKCEDLTKLLHQSEQKSRSLISQKAKRIQKLQKDIHLQTLILEENQLKVDQFNKQNDELRAKIPNSKEKSINSEKDVHPQSHGASKTKLLLDLLLQSQEQVNKLKEKMRQQPPSDKNELISQLNARIQQMQSQHEQEFNEYDQSMREMLLRKDEYIDKLNKMVFNYRKQLKDTTSY